jgi:hypothetical protein
MPVSFGRSFAKHFIFHHGRRPHRGDFDEICRSVPDVDRRNIDLIQDSQTEANLWPVLDKL